MGKETDSNIVYIGTYTSGKSEGIYTLQLDLKTGSLKQAEVSAKLNNPSFLAISRDKKFLYSVLETDSFDNEEGGAVCSFLIDRDTGALEFLNYQSTRGKAPCHIGTDSTNRYLFAANYKDGTIATFSINSDGSIGQILSKFDHSTNTDTTPHAHYVTLTPDEKYLCAVDLGLDEILVYNFGNKNGALSLAEKDTLEVKKGSGPRHMEFHPDGRFAYLITELSSEVVVLEYSEKNVLFKKIQTISTLPEGFNGKSYCAAIHISPDGNYIYASNRGHDSIAVYKIDKTSGKLSYIEHSSTLGKFPRDFAIHPSGKYIIAANQHSGTVVPFSVNTETGKLKQAGDIISIPDPVCVKFL